ncbi:MAG: ATP-binding cassette domain-containing protein [Thermodesulfovibrionales bacterium]|nr:ATP-binding cassette domain-containing protein [Thermodesulfovibrionales bacterium]
MNIVELKDVSVKYRLSRSRPKTFQEYIVGLLKGNIYKNEDFWALKDITFTIQKGENTGIIGQNGAGKSTVLKIIAGVMEPSAGLVKINGKVAPLIELGAGFDMDLTGEENIYLNGSILGLKKKDILKKFDSIIDFSELRDFIYAPLRTYSSGMIARLAFSIAISIDADILIVDEALSVGDEAFRLKCKDKIDEAINHGTTLIFVSHNISEVQNLCDKAIWLHHGKLVDFGDAEIVSRCYMVSNNQRVFEDVPDGHQFKEYIDRLFMNGFANGEIIEGKRYFMPDRQVTRAELIIFLARITGIKRNYKGKKIFDDVDEKHWAFDHVSWLYEKGYIKPIKSENGKISLIKPDCYITYDDACKVLNQIYKKSFITPNLFEKNKLLTRGELAMILTKVFLKQNN